MAFGHWKACEIRDEYPCAHTAMWRVTYPDKSHKYLCNAHYRDIQTVSMISRISYSKQVHAVDNPRCACVGRQVLLRR